MGRRRSDFDVTNRVCTTDPGAIRDEVCAIFRRLFPGASCAVIERGIRDATRLFRGHYPGYASCDTSYHNLQHTLDVTLAMARIMAGYALAGVEPGLAPDLFRFGILAALFHDAGYIRRARDAVHAHGAEYTRTHVSRGGHFLRDYLPRIGMERFVTAAAPTLHFTGYEKAVRRIRVPDPIFRLIGNMLGTADIIAQMSDRCYLEKCYERLYPEFVLGGIDRKTNADGNVEIVFGSAEDLIFRTPEFYRKAMARLRNDLDATLRFAEIPFGGSNLYMQEAEKNVRYAERLSDEGDVAALRRHAPDGLDDAPAASGRKDSGEPATPARPASGV